MKTFRKKNLRSTFIKINDYAVKLAINVNSNRLKKRSKRNNITNNIEIKTNNEKSKRKKLSFALLFQHRTGHKFYLK